jgi:hypothetical protein
VCVLGGGGLGADADGVSPRTIARRSILPLTTAADDPDAKAPSMPKPIRTERGTGPLVGVSASTVRWGEPQSRCNCGGGEPQSWCNCGGGEPQSWCRCGRGEPSSGADVVRGKPGPGADVDRVEPSPGADVAGGALRRRSPCRRRGSPASSRSASTGTGRRSCNAALLQRAVLRNLQHDDF